MSNWKTTRKTFLFDDHAQERGGHGKGFGYRASLRTPQLYKKCGEAVADRLLLEQTHHRLSIGHFNVVLVSNGGNGGCNIEETYGKETLESLNNYLDRFPHTVVATVDGSDLCGCHTTFSDQLKYVDLHFLREADDQHPCTRDIAAKVQLPTSLNFSTTRNAIHLQVFDHEHGAEIHRDDKYIYSQRLSEVHQELDELSATIPDFHIQHLKLMNERRALEERLRRLKHPIPSR